MFFSSFYSFPRQDGFFSFIVSHAFHFQFSLFKRNPSVLRFWLKILRSPGAINSVYPNNTIKILRKYVLTFVIYFSDIICFVILDLQNINLEQRNGCSDLGSIVTHKDAKYEQYAI